MNTKVRVSFIVTGFLLMIATSSLSTDKHPAPKTTQPKVAAKNGKMDERFNLLVSEKNFIAAMSMVRKQGATLAKEHQAQWKTVLQKAFLANPKDVASFNNKDYYAALEYFVNQQDVSCLELLLKDVRLSDSCSPNEIKTILNKIKKLGEKDGPLYATISCQVEKACEAGRFKPEDTDALLDLVRQLAKGLNDKGMSQLASVLIKRYAPNSKAIAAMSPKQWRSIFDTIAVLGSQDSIKALLDGNQAWREGTIADIKDIDDRIRRLGKHGEKLDSMICEQFEKKYVTGDGLDKEDAGAVLEVGDRWLSQLSTEQKTTWRQQFHSRFIQKDVFSGKLDNKNVPLVGSMLLRLDDSDAVAAVSSWLNTNWQAVSFSMVWSLWSSAMPSDTSPVRREMARHVLHCLLDEEKMSKVKLQEASNAAMMLNGIGNGETRSKIAGALLRRYAPDAKSASTLKDRDFALLFHNITRLGNPAGATFLLEQNDFWRKGSIDDVISLFNSAVNDLGEDGFSIRLMICDQFEKSFLISPPKPEMMEKLARGMEDISRRLPPERVELMVAKLEKLYEDKKFLASLDAKQATEAIQIAVNFKSANAARLVMTGTQAWRKEKKEDLKGIYVWAREFDKDNQTPKELTKEEFFDLIDILVRFDKTEDIRKLLTPERLKKMDIVGLGQLGAALGPLGEKAFPLQVPIYEHVELALSKTRAKDLSRLQQLISTLVQQGAIPLDRQELWLTRLFNAINTEKEIKSMDVKTFVTFAMIMRRAETEKVFIRWMATDRWKSEDLGALLFIINKFSYLGKSNDSENLRKITNHIITTYLSDNKSPKNLSPSTWRMGITKLSGFMNESQRRLASQRIFEAYAGDMNKFKDLSSNDVGNLVDCLQTLGHQVFSVQMRNVERATNGQSSQLRDRKNAEEVCGLVLTQVATADPGDRKGIWEIGKTYIADDVGQFSERMFEVISGFIEKMDSDSVLTDAIITELAKRTRDNQDTMLKLERRFISYALQRRIKEEIPATIRESFQQAQQLHAAGKLEEATAAYCTIVDDKGCPDVIRDGLSRRIVSLLLEQATDLAAIDTYLQVMRNKSKTLDKEAWNLSCRTLFRRVAITNQDRTVVWKKGIDDLSHADDIVIRDKTFKDLDTLVTFLFKKGESKFASTILTDMLLLVPDRQTMRRLQWRRIAAFSEGKDWKGAGAAAAMDVLLAAADCQCITPPLERFMDIMRLSGSSEKQITASVCNLLCGSTDTSLPPAVFLDEALRKAAKDILENTDTKHSRRNEYLNLLAGDFNKAIGIAKERMVSSSSSRQTADVLSDIYLIFAVADGGLARANRFGDWLASESDPSNSSKSIPSDDKLFATLTAGEPKNAKTSFRADAGKVASAREFYSHWASEISLSASLAGNTGNSKISNYQYAMILRSKENFNDIAATLDSVVETQKSQMELPDVLTSLDGMLSLLPKSPYHRMILVKMANLAYEEQLYDDCLSYLDDAEELSDENDEKDFTTTMLRVSTMLELEDFDGAEELLAEVVTRKGTDENKAQCMFVTACLRLKQGQTKEAHDILEKLTQQYPRTSVATKARQLAARVE